MTTSTTINAVIDAMISRITTNIASFGGTVNTPVREGDEEPAAVDIFPSLYVVPLLGSGDTMTQHMNSSALFHEFPLTVIGFYKDYTVNGSLRTTRNYGYAMIDLFAGPTNYKITGTITVEGTPVTIGGAVVTSWTLEVMYWRVNDYIVHNFVARFMIKSITGG
jgi:hypothetical protein